MARRHHGINIYDISPDPFVKGKTGKVFYEHDNNGISHFDSWIAPIDYDSVDLERTIASCGTYNTQEIDEHWWFSQSLKMTYQDSDIENDPTYFKNYDISKENLKSVMGGVEVNYSDWLNMAGGYSYWNDGISWWEQTYSYSPWSAFSIFDRNLETEEVREEVLVTEANESELVHTLSARNDNYGQFAYRGTTNLKLLGGKKKVTKIVLFFETEGEIEIWWTPGNTQKTQRFSFVPGRNEFKLDQVVSSRYQSSIGFGFRLISGTIKLNTDRINSQIGTKIWYQWGWTSNEDKNWDLGIGIYIDTYERELDDTTYDWKTPELDDIYQLVGQAPKTSENIYSRVVDFLVYSDEENIMGIDPTSQNLLKSELNTSGLTLFPSGSKENKDPNADYVNVYRAGELICLAVGNDNDGSVRNRKRFNIISTEVGGDRGLSISNSFHGIQYRPIKRKSAGELGYKLYIDEVNDQVLMLPYSANKSRSWESSPLGERLDDNGVWGNFHIGWGRSYQSDCSNAVSVYIKQSIDSNGRNIHFLDKDNIIISTILHDNPSNVLKWVEGRYPVPTDAVKVVWFTTNIFNIYCDVEYMDYTEDVRYELPELTIGLERGVALRYTNRKHKLVLKKWSEIQQEASDIKLQIKNS